eukprot:4550106-Prymnesium_polylepis.1
MAGCDAGDVRRDVCRDCVVKRARYEARWGPSRALAARARACAPIPPLHPRQVNSGRSQADQQPAGSHAARVGPDRVEQPYGRR